MSLTAPRYTDELLDFLDKHPGLDGVDIAIQTGWTPAQVYQVIGDLIEIGRVYREQVWLTTRLYAVRACWNCRYFKPDSETPRPTRHAPGTRYCGYCAGHHFNACATMLMADPRPGLDRCRHWEERHAEDTL